MSRSHKSDRQRNKRRTIAESVVSEEGDSLLVADDAAPKPKVEPGVLDSGVDPRLYKTLTRQAIKEAAKERAEELGGYSKPSNRPKVDPTLTVQDPEGEAGTDVNADGGTALTGTEEAGTPADAASGEGKGAGAGDSPKEEEEPKPLDAGSADGSDNGDNSNEPKAPTSGADVEDAANGDGTAEQAEDAPAGVSVTEPTGDSEVAEGKKVVPGTTRSVLADNLKAISEQSGTGDEGIDAAVASVEEAIKAVLAMPKGHERSEKLRNLSSLRADISSGKVAPGDAPASLDAVMDDGAEGNEDAALDVIPSAPVAKESVQEGRDGSDDAGSDSASGDEGAGSDGAQETGQEAGEPVGETGETAGNAADVEPVPDADGAEVAEKGSDDDSVEQGGEKTDDGGESPLRKYYEKYESQITVPNSKESLDGSQKGRRGRGGRNKGRGKRSRAQAKTMERATVEVKPGTKVKSRDDKDYAERTPEELEALKNADLDIIPSDAEPIDLSTVLTYGNPKLQGELRREREAEERKRGKNGKADGERRKVRNPLAPIGHALADTFRDWREVTWPNAGDTAKMSIAVIISLVIFGAATMGVDAGTVEFMKWFTALRP